MQNLIDASKVRTGVRRWMPGVLATLGVAVAVAGAVGAGLAVADTPSAPAVDISDVPVANLADQSKPNVMLLLDTSDSMKWTHMPDDWEGNATELFPMGYKSALCNTLYYNPDTTYTVPKASDGVADMPTPTFGAAWKDGFDQSKGVVDLATNFQAYDGDTRRRDLFVDKAQPAYYFAWQNTNAPNVRPAPHFEDATEVRGACAKTNITAVNADDGSVTKSARVYYNATTPDGYWVRTTIPEAQRENFAIWYSYYRTRINMAKSSVSLAFASLNDNFRVGFLTVANPGSGDYSKFIPVNDFGGTAKSEWFQAIQSIKTGGTSPAREALARVGRYYAGKDDSINSTMTPFVDPVVSACQRHYAIVTTDGYWNVGQETKDKGPVQIDGVTRVGQQDGPPLSLTGADGLIPRPIFDGSTSGDKLRRDASVVYGTAPCTIGWKITTPGGGTKTETIYKKIVEKDVMTQKQKIADFNWWQKTTSTVVRNSAKVTGTYPKSQHQYWWAQSTSTVTKTNYQQQVLYKYINKKQYRYKAISTWSTATQTPYSKSVAQKVQQKKYFYWYKNPALGETELKTTDKSVCQAFASGCTLQGNDTWAVVQACTPTASDSQGFKIECQSSEVAVAWASYCPAKNGQFVANVGTIQCEGSNVPPYSGPVAACNTIHPTLKDQILAAGGDPAKFINTNCKTNNTETKYVTQAQCVNAAPVFPDYKTTNCQEELIGNSIDNSCPVGSPVQSGTSNNYQYTHCTKESGSRWVAQCSTADFPVTEGNEIERVCMARTVQSTQTVAPGACTNGINGNFFVQCSAPSTTWSGPMDEATCKSQVNTATGKGCSLQTDGWVPSNSCTPVPPSASTGWVGIECRDGGQGTSCTPAPGTEGMTPPAGGPVEPGSCFNVSAAPENGCIYSSCQTVTTGPNRVNSCQDLSPTAPAWQKVTCVPEPDKNVAVPNCSVAGATNCRDYVINKDMAYGSCAAALGNLLGGAGPVEVNNWTTSTCDKVDASTNGGLTYYQSADDFAQCQSGTNADGVKTTCVKDTQTIVVQAGELCVPGYNPSTNKVTDCSGIGQGTTEIVPTKPANCPAATCEEYKGNKKVFSGSYSTYKINLVGTNETGTPTLVNPPGTVNFSGDLETPAICYKAEELSAGAVLPQPPEGRPQPGTPAWSILPAEFQTCSKLPCEQMNTNTVTGGSSNSLADVAQYYYATDLRPGGPDSTPRGWDNLVRPAGTGAEDDKATWQHMATYVIGMGVSGTLKYDPDYKNGAGDFAALRSGAKTWPIWPPASGTNNYEQPQSIDDFWHTAVNGRGRYFSANDPKAIEAGLNEVFTDIRAAVGSGAGVAVSSTVVEAGNNFAYGGQYRSGRWSGDVLAYTIDLVTGVRTQIENWSAKDKLGQRKDGGDERKIYFKPGNSTTLADFKYASLGSLQANFAAAAVQTRMSQYSQMTQAQKDAAVGANLVSYLRGDTSKEGYVKNNVNKLYRTRDGVLGDIIGSQPVYVAKPLRKYKDQGYTQYREAQMNRRPMVYVGSNDGMLHAFYAETDLNKKETIGGQQLPTAAREAWAYVPKAVMPEMARLASIEYEGAHRYFVDGTPVVADIQVEGTWKTILVGGFNKGGKGYYALDVTDPLAPKGLWETADNAALSTMGQSYGRPLVTKMPGGRWVVLLTSGYNNADGKGYVYVLDAATGEVVQTLANALGSGMRELNNFVKDPVGNNTTELFYGGDIEGNIWRYKWDATSYTATKVVQLTDGSGAAQPITTRVELVMGKGSSGLPRILVATGKLMGAGDLTTTAQQSIYGFDDLYGSDGTGSGITNGVSLRHSLKQSVLKNVVGTNGKMTRELSCTGDACKDDTKGWFVDLPDDGERVNVDLRLAGSTVVVSSNVPSEEPCVAGGRGWVNYLNYETGLAVNVDENGKGPAGEGVDGIITGNDLSSNKDNKVTSHVTPSQFPDKPIDIAIPVATPKPLGKRITWRELVK